MKFSKILTYILSFPKTLRFNFHYFPFTIAIKLPVVVSHKTYLRELHGKVLLPDSIRTAMIKIGFGDVGHYDRKYSRSIWQVSGIIDFKGNAAIGHGSKISVRGKVTFGENFNMTAESTIVCAREIAFGNNCLISWDNLIMDTDEHSIYDLKENKRINSEKPIIIGDHVWIGCKCTVLKGTHVADNSIVAAGSFLRNNFSDSNQIIGGNPPIILKKDVNWDF